MMFSTRPPQEVYRRVFELTVALYRVTDYFPKDELLRMNLRSKANEIFESAIEYGHSADIEGEVAGLSRKIDALKGYLGIARAMRLVRPVNFTVLEREYDAVVGMLAGGLAVLHEQEQEAEERIREGDTEDKIKRSGQEGGFVPARMRDSSRDAGEDSRRHASPSLRQRGKKRVLDPTVSRRTLDMNERQFRMVDHLSKVRRAKISDFYSWFTGISTKTIQRDLQDLVERNVLIKEGDKRWTTYALKEERR